MIKLSRLTQYFLLLLLLSPLLSYFTLSRFDRSIVFFWGPIIVFIWIIYFFNSPKKLKVPSYAWWLLFFILYELIYKLIEIGMTAEFLKSVIIYNQNVYVLFMIIIINNTKFNEGFTKKAVMLMKVTVILAAIVSFVQIINRDFWNASVFWQKDKETINLLTGNIYQDRRASIFGYIDMNEIGLSYLPLLSVLTGFLLFYRKKSYPAFLLLGGISALLSNTRYVMISFIIITLQIAIYHRYRVTGVLKYLIMGTVLFFALYQLLMLFGYNFKDWMTSRLFTEGSIRETSRYQAIEVFSMFFPKYAIFGSGGMTDAIQSASTSVGSSQIHVGYLSALVYFGLVGSFFLFGFWFFLIKYLYINAKKTKYWGSFFAFLIFLWANLTLVNFHIFFYGIIFALAFDKYYADKMTTQPILNNT
jgi:hypothetical protein